MEYYFRKYLGLLWAVIRAGIITDTKDIFMSTIERLTILFQEIFFDESIVLTLNTNANDIDGWDSFAHLNIIMSVEQKFNIEISDVEAPTLKNIGDLVSLINNKINNTTK